MQHESKEITEEEIELCDVINQLVLTLQKSGSMLHQAYMAYGEMEKLFAGAGMFNQSQQTGQLRAQVLTHLQYCDELIKSLEV